MTLARGRATRQASMHLVQHVHLEHTGHESIVVGCDVGRASCCNGTMSLTRQFVMFLQRIDLQQDVFA